MESLAELDRICQKPNYRTVGTWMARNLTRQQALVVTSLLLRTPVTATQVTVASIGVGVLAGVGYASAASPWIFLAGALAHQLFYLLDHVDGQIARYRNTVSVTGLYLDYIAHYLVNASTVFGLGFGAFAQSGRLEFLYLALSATIFVTFWGVFFDCRYKAFMKELASRARGTVRVRSAGEPLERQAPTVVRRIFSWLYKAGEGHVVMNTLSAAALASLWLPALSLGAWRVTWSQALTLFYGVLYPAVFLMRLMVHIRGRLADREFESTFLFEDPT